MRVKYSIIVPLKDEEGNIQALVEETESVMGALNEPWEMILINDGSVDKTREILGALAKSKDFLFPLHFTENFGQSAAFDAGFKAAKGEFVITLDGDRQNDPSDIPKLIACIQDFDIVCGIRQKRRDSPIKKITSFLANKVRSKFLADGIKDTGCSLKLYRKSCLEKIKLYHGMHRFLPALFQIEGYRVGQIPVRHRERTAGKTKYNFLNRSLNTVFDMFAVRWMRKRKLNYQIERAESQ